MELIPLLLHQRLKLRAIPGSLRFVSSSKTCKLTATELVAGLTCLDVIRLPSGQIT